MAGEDERTKEWWRQTRWWIPGLLVVVGLLVLVIVGPPALVRASRPDIAKASAAEQLKAENDLRGTFVTVLAGVAVAAGTVVAGLNFTNSRAALEETQRQNRLSRQQDRDQLELTRRGQITERFTKAIDQLGERGDEEHAKLDVRLGGIYALEQIARDSPDDLHWPIIEILTAFIRGHTKADTGAEPKSEQAERVQDPAPILATGQRDKSTASRKVAADIQAALTVLGRRNSASDRGPVDLGEANLQGAILIKADLQGAILVNANLQEANLSHANLQKANLNYANLRNANLDRANLESAYLVRADLQDARLREANLYAASLAEANLRRTFLEQANLDASWLGEANLEGARLFDTKVKGAIGLTQEQLDSANIRNSFPPPDPNSVPGPFKRADVDETNTH